MILLDSSLLLNDFFHRNPAYGTLRTGREASEELLDFWQKSHEALLKLSLEPLLKVVVAEYVPVRLASVLSDLGVPAEMVLDELAYWNGSFHRLSAGPELVEEVLTEETKRTLPRGVPTEDIWLSALARRSGIQYILSPWTRQNTLAGSPRIITPDQLPEVLGKSN